GLVLNAVLENHDRRRFRAFQLLGDINPILPPRAREYFALVKRILDDLALGDTFLRVRVGTRDIIVRGSRPEWLEIERPRHEQRERERAKARVMHDRIVISRVLVSKLVWRAAGGPRPSGRINGRTTSVGKSVLVAEKQGVGLQNA